MSYIEEKCQGCGKELTNEEKEWGVHPGILGPCCHECYHKAVEERPELPWTDPISGQVDYEEMAEALGIDDGTGDYDDFYEDWQ